MTSHAQVKPRQGFQIIFLMSISCSGCRVLQLSPSIATMPVNTCSSMYCSSAQSKSDQRLAGKNGKDSIMRDRQWQLLCIARTGRRQGSQSSVDGNSWTIGRWLALLLGCEGRAVELGLRKFTTSGHTHITTSSLSFSITTTPTNLSPSPTTFVSLFPPPSEPVCPLRRSRKRWFLYHPRLRPLSDRLPSDCPRLGEEASLNPSTASCHSLPSPSSWWATGTWRLTTKFCWRQRTNTSK